MKTQQIEKRTAKTTARQLAEMASRLWPGPLPTWQKPTREKVLHDLPAWAIAIAVYILANYLFLSATAHAQGTTPTTAPPATAGPGVAGALSQLFGTIGGFALLAAIAGYFRPQWFRFLFKEKATKGIVAGSFAAVMLFFGVIGSSSNPSPVVTPTETAAKAGQQKAQAETRVAQAKAAAAEARAEKAEAQAKAAETKKVSDEKSDNSETGRTEKTKPNANRPRSQSDGDETKPGDSNTGASDNSTSSGTNSAGGEELPANVQIEDIPGLGKREVGQVDQVAYTITNIETLQSIGDTRADGTFVIVHLAAANTDKKTHDVTTAMMKLLDDQDREFDPSSNGGMALVMTGDHSAEPFSAQVQPGTIKRLTLVYDVPADASGLKLKIPAGSFSLDSDAVIRVPK